MLEFVASSIVVRLVVFSLVANVDVNVVVVVGNPTKKCDSA